MRLFAGDNPALLRELCASYVQLARVVGVTDHMIEEGRFTFAASVAGSDAERISRRYRLC